MAIYHTRVKTFSRAKQHSSAAAAAYRAGLLIEEADGKKHDYRQRGGVVETRCVVPEDAPEWALDPRLLWPAAEGAERRRDATMAREFEIALPHELDDDQRSALTAEITRTLVDRYGFAAQASIHEPQTPDGLNYHVHILATTRRIGPDGLADKTRELDGGPSGRGEVEWVREMVAHATNTHLQAARLDARVDHRSLKAQAEDAIEDGDMAAALVLSREPTRHLGKNATALHRKGVDCDRVQANRTIDEANEASWQSAIEALKDEGRLLSVPVGHSHAQAQRERGAWAGVSPQPIGEVQGTSHNHSEDRVQPAADALAEAIHLWHEGFISKIGASFRATSQLLRYGSERFDAFAHAATFRSDLHELVKRLKRLKHDAMHFVRRLAAEERAQHQLHRAEFALEHFDAEHSRPRCAFATGMVAQTCTSPARSQGSARRLSPRQARDRPRSAGRLQRQGPGKRRAPGELEPAHAEAVSGAGGSNAHRRAR